MAKQDISTKIKLSIFIIKHEGILCQFNIIIIMNCKYYCIDDKII